LLENTRAELRRYLARLGVVREQIRAIEQSRLGKLATTPEKGPHAIVRLIARVLGVGVETADMLVNEVFRATGATARPLLATPALPAPPMRAEAAGASGALRAPVTLAFGAA
jgi:hypothetical protein